MMVEIGFRNALLDNIVAVIRALRGDLFLTNRERYMISQPVPFPLRRLETARSVEGVVEACPLYLETGDTSWRNVVNGLSKRIRVIAYRPLDDLLSLPDVRDQRTSWNRPEVALSDRRSKTSLFGPLETGTRSELQGKTIRVVGRFALGTDFRNNGTLIMSERNLLRYFPERQALDQGDTRIDVGVIRLAPGADREAVREALAKRMPADVVVLTRAELIAKDHRFWENVAPVGVVFDIGLVMGFIVGMAICYQVLYSEIADRLSQFATLKAMGYTDGALRGFVIRESVDLSLFGFAAGLGVSLVLFRMLQRLTGMDVGLYLTDLGVVLALTVVMCVASGSLAARRLSRVDPAELFG
jgi:putative ABC transport system permease protein